ncbi:MAG TPA: tetratricopeptide repeat protein [Allosphingosinicella sp.]
MTDGDDDIAAALPRAPLPAPARREAAIAEAMRRFDGGGEQAPAAGRPAAGPAPWRTRFNRPQAGALAGAFLVALIALPLAWTSLPDWARDGGRDRRSESRDGATRSGPAAAAPSPSAADPAAPAPLPPGEPDSPSPAAGAAPDTAAPARVDLTPAPATAGEPAPGDSAAVVVTGTRIRRPDQESGVPVTSMGGEEIVVTGSRMRRPNLESSVPITSIGGEGFFRTRKAARRGDWNACTVDDPKRDPGACRRDVGTVARGASGKASAHLADGLSRAWEGDRDGAIAAFDRAIELAPRSAAAYLNRGLARRDAGDLDRALADLDRAIAYAPQSARGYYHRSLLLRQRGDGGRARADEARAVELDPRYAAAVRAGRRQER